MGSVTELACLLSSALEPPAPDSRHVCALLSQLVELLQSPEAVAELKDLIFDLHVALVHAAALSPAAEAAVRELLSSAAAQCIAREVFTLCMATLSHELSCRHGEGGAAASSQAYGPSSPSFQLFLLAMLHCCLPRICRRPLHFCAELLDMQLRWAAEVLPGMPLSEVTEPAAAAEASEAAAGDTDNASQAAPGSPLTVAGAVGGLARLVSNTAQWAQQAGGQLSAQEQQAARQLLSIAMLQLVSITLQLPQNLEAAAAALPAQVHGGAPVSAPSAGSRLPVMQAAAEAVLWLPQALLQQLPGCTEGSSSPEDLWRLAEHSPVQLVSSGLDPSNLAYFSAADATEGAAAAACAGACSGSTVPQPPEQLRCFLMGLLPRAACLLLDLGAQHRSVALTLLPLCMVCESSCQLAASSATQLLAASSPDLDALLASLVAIMSHNPMQLVRSCAHDAVHALLHAFQPGARLAQLRAMMQMPSTTAAVVALQCLRQEMAAAWEGGAAGGGSLPWVSAEALQLALPCLKHGTADSYCEEQSVLEQADVQAAALSLLRWVLLREVAAPRGLLPRERAQQLLQHNLLPLRACVRRLLQMQSASMAGGRAISKGGNGSSSGEEPMWQQQLLDSFLAMQRLHEAVGCVIDLVEAQDAQA